MRQGPSKRRCARSTKSATQLSGINRNVFINCPFDADYRASFEALLFTVMVSGYKVRCALEDGDAANIRFDKLRRLIRESPRTIHDLSRTELGENELPRFNMPFELGLAMGAKSLWRAEAPEQHGADHGARTVRPACIPLRPRRQ
jgi:hypothetical protein